MAKYRRPFLRALQPRWAGRFPNWKQGLAAPVSWARPDSTFTNAGGHDGLLFHVVLDFSPKSPGAFTADIVLTPSLKPLKEPFGQWPEDLESRRASSYRIGWIVGGRDLWWHLRDEAAESQRFWDPLRPGDLSGSQLFVRGMGHWYAASYEVPLAVICDEASEHFCDTFERVLRQIDRTA